MVGDSIRNYRGMDTDGELWYRALPVFEQVFATKKDREEGRVQQVKLITIWLGTFYSIVKMEVTVY